MRIVAIDPGLGGAWAVVIDGRATLCGDMPVSGEGTQRRVAPNVLASLFRSDLPDLCVVEMVSAMPKNGVAGMFRFGMAYGAALAVPAVLGVPVEIVRPTAWKSHFTLHGKEKEASRQKALDLCPWLSDSLARKRDDGRAEAVLLGLYAAATWGSARAAA